MTDGAGLVLAIAAAWVVIGVVLSVVMGRRGHNSFGWLILGVMLGPLAVVMAVDAGRHEETPQATAVVTPTPAAARTGPVDVLVGYDGSPESAAAADAAAALLGERLGRLTVASVVAFGDVRERERVARVALLRLAERMPGHEPELKVLHGHPSSALRQCAVDGGYDLIVVGTRGGGISKSIIGSAANELARDSKVPVLLVGNQGGP